MIKSPSEQVYLDNASTTKLAPEVLESMHEVLTSLYANASAIHRSGSLAARRVEKARGTLAERLQCNPEAVLFTGGGTEANNHALKSVVAPRLRQGQPTHLIVAAIEHSSVLETAAWLEAGGARVTRLQADSQGMVTATQVAEALAPETVLVSIMQGNNEMGTLQPIQAIAAVCREAGVLFHTDACQSFPREPLLPEAMGIDLATLNAHKVHGPKGVGALYVRPGLVLEPLLHGGGQEGGWRAGTLNTPAIVGFGRAVELVTDDDTRRVRALRDRLIDGMLERVPQARLTGHRTQRLATIASFVFPGYSGKSLQRALDLEGVTVATGSACHSGSLAPSHVLCAMGVDEATALGSVRFSLSRYTTPEEVDRAVEATLSVLARLGEEATTGQGQD